MSTDGERRVESIMTTAVERIDPDATLREAAAAMHERGIRSLLVPGAEIGIVTSTDVLAALADGRDPDACSVADVMTVPVEWVEPDLQLREAAAMMRTYGINHLPVRDRSGDYVGMVSTTDLRETLADPPDDR